MDDKSFPTPSGRTVEKVPISELPKPNPKAQKRLNKVMNQDNYYKALIDRLDSLSFTIVGDNSEHNWLFAQELAERLGWLPVRTQRIIAGMQGLKPKKATEEEVVRALGSREKLVDEERGVLKGLSRQSRVVAASSSRGAAGHRASYQELWGTFIIWLDESDSGAAQAAAPEMQVIASCAELKVPLPPVKQPKGFGGVAGPVTPQQRIKAAADLFMINMAQLLNQQPDIVVRKKAYMHYGCRGDWPELKPPEWSPVFDALEREPPPNVQAEADQAKKAEAQAQEERSAS